DKNWVYEQDETQYTKVPTPRPSLPKQTSVEENNDLYVPIEQERNQRYKRNRSQTSNLTHLSQNFKIKDFRRERNLRQRMIQETKNYQLTFDEEREYDEVEEAINQELQNQQRQEELYDKNNQYKSGPSNSNYRGYD
ncbi:34035_t:CDS:2, partial [Racocetra persica]